MRTLRFAATSIWLLTGFIAFTGSALTGSAQDTARAEIQSRIQQSNSTIGTSFWVKYRVDQRDFGPRYEEYMHVPGASGTPATRWYGEHAHAPGGKKFDYTSLAAEKSDKKCSLKLSDGECFYDQVEESDLINVYRGSGEGFQTYLLPAEDLYREIIGQESRRQGIGQTIRGFQNPEPYDISAIVVDPTFVMDKTDAKSVRFSKPGVENLWLDPAKDYAVTRIERTIKGVLAYQVENSEFELVGSKVWLPRKSVLTYFDDKGAKVGTSILTVRELSLAPPDKLFKPQLDKFKGLSDIAKGFNPVKLGPMNGMTMIEFLDSAPKLAAEPVNTLGSGRLRTWGLCLVLMVAAMLVYRRWNR